MAMSDALNPRYGTIDGEYGLRLAGTSAEDDGPVWMVNLMRYREVADYADGRETTISGREADDRYAPVEILGDIGAAPVFFGDVDQQLLGSPNWDRVAVVKYATRRSFIDMQTRPDFQLAHEHKDAGMAETIVMGCLPLPYPTAPPDVVFPDWADVEHPPTAEDGPITVVHVMRLRRDRARGWRAGSPSRAPSSATAGSGIRCGSTSFRASGRSWRWPQIRNDSGRRPNTGRKRSPIPTPCWCVPRSTSSRTRSGPDAMACVFCEIVAGRAPAIRVHEDDDFLGFLDIRPFTRGHTLVIPKSHSVDLTDTPANTLAGMLAIGQRIAQATRVSGLAATGNNIAINDGKSAMQSVFHIHLHVIPRRDGDKVSFVKGMLLRRDPNREATGAILRDAVARLP